MNIWNKAPFVRLIIPFIFGIIVAIYYPAILSARLNIILIFGILLIGFVIVILFKNSYRNARWRGVLINLLLLFLGFQLTIFNTEIYSSNHYMNGLETQNFAHVRLNEVFQEKENSLKVEVDVLGLKTDDKWVKYSGKLLLYIHKSKNSKELSYGDELIINAKIAPIASPSNPNQFDYKRYLSMHQLHYSSYLSDKQWVNTSINSANLLYRLSYDMRNYLITIFKEYNIKGQELAVGTALILGYKDYLDVNTIDSYSHVGVMHILAVSGLHVGIIYWVFNLLLSFLNRIKYGNIIKALLLIFFLWFYAMLTGLSPSVLRAATMFSLIIIAEASNRQTNIYNTLAVSAFLLLLIDPFLLMSVGFQMSYCAVIGIVTFYPSLNKLLHFDNWILKNTWSIIIVSIVAQIATAPLALYYFHQFPNYFIVSNLLVIPLATLSIYTGILLFVFAKVSIVANVLATIFSALLSILNKGVDLIATFPYSSITGISISLTELFLLYIIIFSVFWFLKSRKGIFMIGLLFSIITLLVFQILKQKQQLSQRQIIVYDIKNHTAIDFISERESILLTDSTLQLNSKKVKYAIESNWISLGIPNPKQLFGDTLTPHFFTNKEFVQFYNKRIVWVKEDLTTTSSHGDQLEVDYVIFSNNVKSSIQEVLKKYNPKLIIFDSSNSFYHVNKWKNTCDILDLKYYDVSDKGAFIDPL